MTNLEVQIKVDDQCAYLQDVARYARQITIASRGDGRPQRLRLPGVDDQWKQRILLKLRGGK